MQVSPIDIADATASSASAHFDLPDARKEKALALVGAAWPFVSTPGSLRAVSPRLATDAVLVGTQRAISAAFSRAMWEKADEDYQLAAVDALERYLPDYMVMQWQGYMMTTTGFHEAAQRGHTRVVTALLAPTWADGVDVKASEWQLPHALLGAPALLAKVLTDKRFRSGEIVNSTLALCAQKGDATLLPALLANRKHKIDSAWHVLSMAACSGHEHIVRILLADSRFRPNESATHGGALFSAAAGGHAAIVDLLMTAKGVLRPMHLAYALKQAVLSDEAAAFASLHADARVPLTFETLQAAMYIARFPGPISSERAFASSRAQHNVHIAGMARALLADPRSRAPEFAQVVRDLEEAVGVDSTATAAGAAEAAASASAGAGTGIANEDSAVASAVAGAGAGAPAAGAGVGSTQAPTDLAQPEVGVDESGGSEAGDSESDDDEGAEGANESTSAVLAGRQPRGFDWNWPRVVRAAYTACEAEWGHVQPFDHFCDETPGLPRAAVRADGAALRALAAEPLTWTPLAIAEGAPVEGAEHDAKLRVRWAWTAAGEAVRLEACVLLEEASWAHHGGPEEYGYAIFVRDARGDGGPFVAAVQNQGCHPTVISSRWRVENSDGSTNDGLLDGTRWREEKFAMAAPHVRPGVELTPRDVLRRASRALVKYALFGEH